MTDSTINGIRTNNPRKIPLSNQDQQSDSRIIP
eukprot:UN11975